MKIAHVAHAPSACRHAWICHGDGDQACAVQGGERCTGQRAVQCREGKPSAAGSLGGDQWHAHCFGCTAPIVTAVSRVSCTGQRAVQRRQGKHSRQQEGGGSNHRRAALLDCFKCCTTYCSRFSCTPQEGLPLCALPCRMRLSLFHAAPPCPPGGAGAAGRH